MDKRGGKRRAGTKSLKTMTYTLEFLQATYGDSIWITYGQDTLHHMLIDGGTAGTARAIRRKLSSLPEGKRHLELLVITHVDRDHIEGIMKLLDDQTLPCTIGEVWFNGWQHLAEDSPVEQFGAIQGERLSTSIQAHGLAWNRSFNGKAVVVPDKGKLPAHTLAGGMKLTLLSPYRENLSLLMPAWEREVKAAGLVPGAPVPPRPRGRPRVEAFGPADIDVDALNEACFSADTAPGNGSSIGLLAEFGGKACLLAGDTWPGILLRSAGRLSKKKLRLEACKISHHASAGNTSPELLEKLDCSRFVISTNGAIYQHPDRQAIARIIKRSSREPQLHFNYRTPYSEVWDDQGLKDKHHYKTRYAEGKPLVISLGASEQQDQ